MCCERPLRAATTQAGGRLAAQHMALTGKGRFTVSKRSEALTKTRSCNFYLEVTCQAASLGVYRSTKGVNLKRAG